MIDNNIIQSLGAGSGIDTNNLVKQLVSIERAAPQQRIDAKRELTETKISDFGLLSSALSTLKDAAAVLTDPEGLYSKTASYTESDALVPTELDTNVQEGSYSFTVQQMARAQSLAFEGFSSVDDEVGEGDITFSFGSWSRDVNGDIDGSFTADADQTSVTITIDGTNNSLEGLRDAINEENFGVTATIVFDGTDYHLTLLAESGEQHQLEITVDETGGTPTNTDDSDLSRFAFNESRLQHTGATVDIETQGGQDAELTINGLSVTRSSNTVDDIVDGLSLDILGETGSGETVTVTVSNDSAFAEQNIRDFVDAYNAFLEALEPVFGSFEVEDEEGKKETRTGSLANDSLAKSTLSQIRTLIATEIPGLYEANLTSLTNIGIRTETDGTLTIDEDDFESALEDNFEDVQNLFAPSTNTDTKDFYINSYNDNTKAGSYDVVITTQPSKGVYQGGAINAGITFPYDTSGITYEFVVEVNGRTSATLSLPEASYDDEDAIADALQILINSDETINDAGASVTVEFNSGTGGFDITSNSYGASSTVEFSSVSEIFTTDFGIDDGAGTAGTTVAGTINGVTAFGSANVLLPALGEDGEGLAIVVGENATSGTAYFSRGFAGQLESLIESFLDKQGPIAQRNTTLKDNLDDLDDDEKALDRRIEAYQERLIQQYIAMERIISSINSSGGFLENLINTLPFTASKNN